MNKQNIPVFFSCDDNYVPFLMVTLKSIIKNSSSDNTYNIYILHTGINDFNQQLIKDLEQSNMTIEFVDLKDKIKHIQSKLDKVRDYYTKAIFFRIFIASLFPTLKKAIYLDCDIVVLQDLEKLYNIDIENNILGAVIDDVVTNNNDFIIYTKEAVGVEAKYYFNSGVLLINLDEYRKHKIEEKFLKIIEKYDFQSVAPDQDFLNITCLGKVKYLDKSWNKMPIEDGYNKELNLIHYNMFMKPWCYDILYQEHFWKYAEDTHFYPFLLSLKQNHTEEKKKSDLDGVRRMVESAYKIIEDDNNLLKIVIRENI